MVWDRVWDNQPSEAKDDSLIDRERRNPRWAMIVARLEEAFGKLEGLRTIELGSGRGDLSVLLAQRGADVTLFDASAKALEQARSRFDRLGLSARFEEGDFLTGLEPVTGRFDLSLSSGVIEHFKHDERTDVIGAHFDVLRPGGMSVISVPHARCVPYRIWKAYLELRGWWPYGMELPYSARELSRRMTQAGFSRPEMRAMGFWQSVGDHWGKRLLGRKPDWVERTSCVDRLMGMSLIGIGFRANRNEGSEGAPS